MVLSADEVYASTVNIWEIIINLLHIKHDHAIKLIDLEDYHGDQFDRMLIAQSLVEPLHLVTCDSLVAKYNANIIRV